jgi:hypothetical protein
MSVSHNWFQDSDYDSQDTRRDAERSSPPQRSSQSRRTTQKRSAASGYNGIHRRRNKRWSW